MLKLIGRLTTTVGGLERLVDGYAPKPPPMPNIYGAENMDDLKEDTRTLAECIDDLDAARQTRLELQKRVDTLAETETYLRGKILDDLKQHGLSGAAGTAVRVSIKDSTVPSTEDYAALCKYIQETGQFDLMQRRLNDAAVRDRWGEGLEVPGVGRVVLKKLSINKI